MNFDLQPLEPEQRNYTYTQSSQISCQTGLIGYLRTDMGSNGTEFYSSWFGFRDDLKTVEFETDLEEVINALRFEERCGGILKSRNDMRRICQERPESGFDGNYRTEYGFRVDTEQYAYLLRLNPAKGDYNLYCWCYRRDWLDRHLQNAAKGIRFITPTYQELFRLADGDRVRIITANDEKRDYTARYIDDYHVELHSGGRNTLYHICQLAEWLEKTGCKEVIPLRSSLPERCYSNLLETGMVVQLKKGETGYYPTDIPITSGEEAQALVEQYNQRLGVSKAQYEAMKAGSMFGFACPAADPKNYDENGVPIKPGKDRRDAR